ncbi:MAG: hypothetical protein OEL53_05600 [Rhodospirillales bacterium]|nr:hypothetical protein [Rhodospirillales bacterium]
MQSEKGVAGKDVKDRNVGKLARITGWVIVIYAVLRYSYAYYDIYSDASVRAYAFLVLIEGGFYLIVGLVVIFAGRWIERKAAAAKKQGEA